MLSRLRTKALLERIGLHHGTICRDGVHTNHAWRFPKIQIVDSSGTSTGKAATACLKPHDRLNWPSNDRFNCRVELSVVKILDLSHGNISFQVITLPGLDINAFNLCVCVCHCVCIYIYIYIQGQEIFVKFELWLLKAIQYNSLISAYKIRYNSVKLYSF
jgi:hypothetical protein